MRIPGILLACALLNGCAVSRHHLGFRNLGANDRPFSMVGERYVKNLSAVEAFWVKTLAAGNLDALAPVMAPRLSEALSNPAVRQKTTLKIRTAYGMSGEYEIVSFGVPFFSLQPGVKKDAYDYYDMLGTAFKMEGKIAASMKLYVTKVDGELKLCGFEIYPDNEGDREAGRDVRFVFPETENRSNTPIPARQTASSK